MDQKDIYTNLFSESFRNDPGIQMQLSGIQNSDHIFHANCKGEIEAFWQLGFISSVEEDGLLIGYASEQSQPTAFAAAMRQIPRYCCKKPAKQKFACFKIIL